MKRLFNIFLIIILCISVYGCGKEEVKQEKKKIPKEKTPVEITGPWYLNRNTLSIDPTYSSLRDLFGDSLKGGEAALVLNDDGTFSLTIGLAYNMIGNYKYSDSLITFSNIEDSNVENEEALKEREENLHLEYIQYQGHKFMKMEVSDIVKDTYIFFEKEPEEFASTFADDKIPDADSTKTDNAPNNDTYTKTKKSLEINGYTLRFGLYSGKYEGSSYEQKIKINNDNTVTLYGAEGAMNDYPFTVVDNTIKIGSSTIEIVGDNKIKFTSSDVVLKFVN